MGLPELTVKDVKEMFLYVSEQLKQNKEFLNKADRAIGDGDHGVGMSRGFEAVRQKLEEESYQNISEVLKAIGMTLLTSIGGASGVVFGTLFIGGAKRIGDQTSFDSRCLSAMLLGGTEAVKERGRAKLGDKTMIDALEPAAVAAKEHETSILVESMKLAMEASREGMEKTKKMVARLGKARPLGQRSLGHPDPGALSIYLILKAMSEFVEELMKT
ncbi:MAG: dihydroxyacetone kinase subunit L [Spirochaetota bacterium]|nr:MAG: dihydroxyacetone kinase subunit L [Spirochaetota bacterium]